ncbi:MAG: hypothetical protein ACFFCQ_15660, partial [Promethearchaeota archaeon]
MDLRSVKEVVKRLRIKNSLINSMIPLIPLGLGANLDFKYTAFIVQVFLLNCYVFWINDYYDAPFDKEDIGKRERNIFCDKESIEAELGTVLVVTSAIIPILIGLLIDPIQNTENTTFILTVIALNYYVFWINDYNTPLDAKNKIFLAGALISVLFGLFFGPKFIFFSFGFLLVATLYVHPIFRGKQRKFWDILFHIAWPVITFYYSYTYFFMIDEMFWIFSLFFSCSAIYSQMGQQLRD